jgi:hypothetical protein
MRRGIASSNNKNIVTSNKGAIINFKPSANHSTTTKNPDYKGMPNSSITRLIKMEIFYFADGLEQMERLYEMLI